MKKIIWLVLVVMCFSLLAALLPIAQKSAEAAEDYKYKIAYICFVNNPWWLQQKRGAMVVKKKLAPLGIKVDWITASPTPSVQALNDAVDNAIAQEYDGILFAPFSPAHAPYTQKAMDAGIPVIQFALYVKDLPSLAYVGTDFYEGGQISAQAVLEGLKKRGITKGKVGILTALGLYDEWLRDEGFRAYFGKHSAEYGEFELLDDVDSKDSPDVILNQTLNLISAYPDLVGIYLCSGSQYAMANAILQAEAQDKIVAVAHEGTVPNLESLIKGGFYCLVDAHAYRTSIKAGLVMADYLLNGVKPPEFVHITHTMIWPNDAEGVKAEMEATIVVDEMHEE